MMCYPMLFMTHHVQDHLRVKVACPIMRAHARSVWESAKHDVTHEGISLVSVQVVAHPGVRVPLWELLSVLVHPGLTTCTLPSLPPPFAPQVMSSTPGFIVSKEKNPTPTLPVPIALSSCTSCHHDPNQTGPASAPYTPLHT